MGIVQVRYKRGVLAFSTTVLLYFENGTRYGLSYNGRRTGLVCDPSRGGSRIFERGAGIERRRREDRGAVGELLRKY